MGPSGWAGEGRQGGSGQVSAGGSSHMSGLRKRGRRYTKGSLLYFFKFSAPDSTPCTSRQSHNITANNLYDFFSLACVSFIT